MSDSVDRVFSHALNTVNKIRTGSQKPPAATRLKLYGLYKQAMEGDVEGIMERASGSSTEDQRAREKWDAWQSQTGLSRTEAKRQYITTLIDTMHTYASPSPDSRELVTELEFVWDQVKSNVSSSTSSSPLRTMTGELGMHVEPGYAQGRSGGDKRRRTDDNFGRNTASQSGLPQVKRPMSQSEEEDGLDEEQDELGREEFVDASEDAGGKAQAGLAPTDPFPYTPSRPPRTFLARAIAAAAAPAGEPPRESVADQKWRRRVEQSLVKMTAEIAALREQLEARRLFSHSRRYVFLRSIWRFLWGSVKHIALDLFVLGLLLLWLRRRRDKRLEGAVRVLLGDAVAQVQRVGGVQLGKVKVPGLRVAKTKVGIGDR